MPVGYLPIYNSIKSFCEHLHGVSIINGQVRIFARLNGTNPIRYASDFRRIAGDSFQRVLHAKPFLGGKTRADRQILDTGYRMVGGDGDQYARIDVYKRQT